MSAVSVERSRSPAETEAIGGRLAGSLEPGDVVVVTGELGAGKTTLIRGASRALGVTGRVQSPTFTIGRRYRGRVDVSHLDLLRVDTLEGEDPGLLDDYLTSDAISFVEWPGPGEPGLDLASRGAGKVRRVRIAHRGGDEREIAIDD
jgi:tRNA threonylcarbamoyladenosine biosynthesis protein TsaE